MSSVFGIDLDLGGASEADKAPRRTRRRKKTSTKKATKTRAAAARKKPATRTKATKKSASAKSTTQEDALVEENTGRRQSDNGQEIWHGQGQREDEGGLESDCHEIKEDGVIERKRPNRPRPPVGPPVQSADTPFGGWRACRSRHGCLW